MDKKIKKNKGGRPAEDVANKVDFEQIEKLAGYNHTDVEMADILGISESTFHRYKKDERFVIALKSGKARADSLVVEALHKRAVGYEYEEVTYEAMRLNSTSLPSVETAPVKVKTVVKQVEPNPTAIIFWLKNRQPDRWRDVREGERPPAPGDKAASIDKLIADAEARVQRAGDTCH